MLNVETSNLIYQNNNILISLQKLKNIHLIRHQYVNKIDKKMILLKTKLNKLKRELMNLLLLTLLNKDMTKIVQYIMLFNSKIKIKFLSKVTQS